MKNKVYILLIIVIMLMISGCSLNIHSHILKEEIINEPTCTDHGYKYKVCIECNEFYDREFIPPLTHNYEIIELIEAGLFEDGKKVLKCNQCSKQIEEVLLATHRHAISNELTEDVAPTCTSKGVYSYRCTKDGCTYKMGEYLAPALGHDFIFVKGKDPTCYSTGIANSYTCSRCNNLFDVNFKFITEEHLVIPMTNHKEILSINNENDPKQIIKTCEYCEVETARVLYTETKGLSFKLNEEQNGYICMGFSSLYDMRTIDLVIPEMYNNLPVVEIAARAFRYHNTINNVIIPGTVKTIGQESFYGCPNICNIIICDGVEDIGPQAFRYIYGTSYITLPNSLINIRENAFQTDGLKVVLKYDGTLEEWKNIIFDNEYSNPFYSYSKISEFYILDNNGKYYLSEDKGL